MVESFGPVKRRTHFERITIHERFIPWKLPDVYVVEDQEVAVTVGVFAIKVAFEIAMWPEAFGQTRFRGLSLADEPECNLI